jgi:hypothetical protein
VTLPISLVRQSISQFAAHALICCVSSKAGRHWIHLVPIYLLPIFSACLLLSPARAPLFLSLSHSNARQVRAHGSRLFHVPRNLCFYSNSPFVCFVCLSCFFGFCRKSVSDAGVKEEGWRTFLSLSLSLSLCDTVWYRICVPSFFFSFCISSFLGGVFFLYNHIHIEIPPWSPILLLSCNQHPSEI